LSKAPEGTAALPFGPKHSTSISSVSDDRYDCEAARGPMHSFDNSAPLRIGTMELGPEPPGNRDDRPLPHPALPSLPTRLRQQFGNGRINAFAAELDRKVEALVATVTT
jgi:hypothetical protein